MRKNTNYNSYKINEQARRLILAAYPLLSSTNTLADYLNMRSEMLDTIELFNQLAWANFSIVQSGILIQSNLEEGHDLFNQVTSINDVLLCAGLNLYCTAVIKSQPPSGKILINVTTRNKYENIIEILLGSYRSSYVASLLSSSSTLELQAHVDRLTNIIKRCLGADLSSLELILKAINRNDSRTN